ncbi:MAG: recombination mediator RecR [Armatimonadota bacterium]
MLQYARPLQRVIEELERLPGIGPKSAQRLAFFLLRNSPEMARSIGEAISALPDNIQRCVRCHNYTEHDLCSICEDETRDQSVICVVEEVSDLMAFERSGEYSGLYHLLGGLLSPLEGVGPADIHIDTLLERIDEDGVEEIILATSPTVEGDATAEHLHKIFHERFPHVRVTRIALGLPVGADLDYQDQVTVARALSGRQEMR